MVRVKDIRRDDYVAVRDNEPLTRLFGKLLQNRQTEAFVFSSESPSAEAFVGMFAYPHLPYRVGSNSVSVRTVTRPVPQLHQEDEMLRAGHLFYESGRAALPVVDGGGLSGVAYAVDALPHLCRLDGVAGLRVDELPLHPAAVQDGAAIADAIGMMRSQRTDVLPVVDSDGSYIGSISYLGLVERYYVQAYARDNGMAPGAIRSESTRAFKADFTDVLSLPINSIVDRADITLAGSDPLPVVAERLAGRDSLGLVVIQDGKPPSVVTLHDVLHAIISTQSQETITVQFRGLRELDIDDYSVAWIKKISSYYAEKMQVSVNNEAEFIVHLKERSNAGGTHRYTVNTRLTFPGATLVASAQEWDLRRAVHEAFQALEVELVDFLRRNESVASVNKLAAQTGDANLPGSLATE